MKRPAMPFVFLVLVALAALFVPSLGSAAAPAQPPGPINSGDVAWMLTASALVLLMTPGLSFFYGGMVRFKNVVSTMLQSFVALGVISLLWVVVGFSLAFGDSIDGLIGNPLTFFMFDGVGGATHPGAVADDSAAAVRAVPAEVRDHHAGADHRVVRRARASSRATCCSCCLFSLFIYAPLAHWTWHPQGFLR